MQKLSKIVSNINEKTTGNVKFTENNDSKTEA